MFSFTTRVRIYYSIYPITESIYEIIAKYKANDDQCCLLTSTYLSHKANLRSQYQNIKLMMIRAFYFIHLLSFY